MHELKFSHINAMRYIYDTVSRLIIDLRHHIVYLYDVAYCFSTKI